MHDILVVYTVQTFVFKQKQCIYSQLGFIYYCFPFASPDVQNLTMTRLNDTGKHFKGKNNSDGVQPALIVEISELSFVLENAKVSRQQAHFVNIPGLSPALPAPTTAELWCCEQDLAANRDGECGLFWVLDSLCPRCRYSGQPVRCQCLSFAS